jgi:hypothetical protein
LGSGDSAGSNPATQTIMDAKGCRTIENLIDKNPEFKVFLNKNSEWVNEQLVEILLYEIEKELELEKELEKELELELEKELGKSKK